MFVSYHPHCKKKSPGHPVKLFFALFKLNITFYFKCYLHHNCSINLNEIIHSFVALQNHCIMFPALYSDLQIFVFFHFCTELAFRNERKSGCYAHKWIGKKEMSAKVSKCLCRNLFKPVKFLDSQHKISIVLWLSYLRKHFSFIWQQCKYYQAF